MTILLGCCYVLANSIFKALAVMQTDRGKAGKPRTAERHTNAVLVALIGDTAAISEMSRDALILIAHVCKSFEKGGAPAAWLADDEQHLPAIQTAGEAMEKSARRHRSAVGERVEELKACF